MNGPLKVRVNFTTNFPEATVAAYCRYHRHSLETMGRREIADHLRGTLEQVGWLGLEEQLHEGGRLLEHEAAGGREETFVLNEWKNED